MLIWFSNNDDSPMNCRYTYCTAFNSYVSSFSHFHFFTLRVFVLLSSLCASTIAPSSSSLFIVAPSPIVPSLHCHHHESFASTTSSLCISPLHAANTSTHGHPHASNTSLQRHTSFSPHLTTTSDHLLSSHQTSHCHPRRTAPATPL